MKLQSQPHRLRYPLTAQQVEDLDEMLAILFKQQQALAANTTTTTSTGIGGTIVVGPIGPPGQDGLDGSDGPPGINGTIGVNGAMGAPGIDGSDGSEGSPGPPGAIGLTGVAGATGPQGPIGLAIDGVDGLDGMGIPGPVGPTGVQGIDGATGAAGGLIWYSEAGYDGIDGYPGPMGPQGAAGAAGTGSAWTTVKKTSDVARNNSAGGGANVVVADSELLFPMVANKTYTIRGSIWFSIEVNANLGVGMATQFTGPASPTVIVGEILRTGSNNLSYNTRLFSAYDSVNVSQKCLGTNTPQGGIIHFNMLIQNGANAGNFTFNWVGESSTAGSCIVRKGSFIEYIEQA